MRFYTNVQMVGDNFLVRGYEDGKHFMTREKFYPTLFVPSKRKTKYKTLEGDYVESVDPGTVRECREFIRKYSEVENFKIYGNDRYIYQYISEKYPEEEIKFDVSKIKITTLDIEVKSENGFPDVESAAEEILLISIQDYNTKQIRTWGQGGFDNKQENVIYRGFNSDYKIDRVQGDYMGMLATIINGLALQNALENIDIPTRLQSAIKMESIAEPFIKRKATRHLEKGRVVIFASGTGNPYFTTDSAAVLRAIEINADVILKGTRVDGIYDDDPNKNSKAFKFEKISFSDAIKKGLKIMDSTAFTLSQENKLPIIVFDINKEDNLLKVVKGDKIGTLVNL